MRTIWKYALPLDDVVVLRLPRGATPLTVQMQDSFPMLWAVIDEANSEDLVDQRFYIYGTGHPMREDTGRHLGTVQLHGGRLVFHVFLASK